MSNSNIIVRLEDVTMVNGQRLVLKDVNFTVNTGDFVAITGPNGGGKTTLLRIILGLLQPTSGTVTVQKGIAIGYLPQKNMIDSHFPVSVREVVASGLLSVRGLTKAETVSRVEAVIDRIDMRSHADSPIGALSGGQLQRTLLGRAIICQPRLLVLDEPLSYIDKRFEQQLYNLVRELAQEATILLVSHEMSAISAMANRHFIIDRTVHECSAHHHYFPPECE